MAGAVGSAQAALAVEGVHQRTVRIADVVGAVLRRHQAERLARGLREERGIGQSCNLGADANPAPELRDRLRHLLVVRVAVVGGVQRGLEAVRVPCLGQQRTGPLRIEGRHAQRIGCARRAGGQQVGRDRGGTLHHAVDDGGAVDGKRQRPAHAHVLQRILRHRLAVGVADVGRDLPVHVHGHVHHPHAGDLRHVHRRIAAQAGQVLHRHLVDRVDVAGQQRRHAARIGRDHAELRGGEGGRGAVPVRIALHGDELAEAVISQHIGAAEQLRLLGIEVGGLEILAQRLGHHRDLGHVLDHERIGFLGAQVDGAGVLHLDFRDRTHKNVVGAGRAFDPRHAPERVGDILSRQRAAVAELRIAAQAELPHRAVADRAPAFGDAGHRLAVG